MNDFVKTVCPIHPAKCFPEDNFVSIIQNSAHRLSFTYILLLSQYCSGFIIEFEYLNENGTDIENSHIFYLLK